MRLQEGDFLKACMQLLNSKDLPSAWATYTKILSIIGFDRLLYLSTHYRTYGLWGDPRDTLILSSHTQEYNDQLFNAKIDFLNSYPGFEWLINNPGSHLPWQKITQEDIKNNKLLEKFKTLNENHNVMSGIKLSLEQTNPESSCVILLTGKKIYNQIEINNIWDKHYIKILSISKILQLSIRSLPYTGGGIGPKHQKLSKRQSQVLSLISSGNTVMEVAHTLKLSVPTIDKHLKLARNNLSVNSTAQAVAKAEREKMLSPLNNI